MSAPTLAPLTPHPGKFHSPDSDGKEEYNAITFLPTFQYCIQGLNSEHLQLKIHVVTTWSWAQAKPYSTLLVPIFMAYSRSCMTEAKNDIQIFLSHAFPDSPDLFLIPAIALKNNEERKPTHREDPLPWAIMVENLKKEEAEILIFYQIWLSKKHPFLPTPLPPSSPPGLGTTTSTPI